MSAQPHYVDVEPNSDDWVKARMTHIGASDAPAIFMPRGAWYRWARDVQDDKLGLSENKAPSPAMLRGHLLEPLVVEAWKKKNPFRTVSKSLMVEHAIHRFLSATPDRFLDLEQLLEIKTVRDTVFARTWGEPGTENIPEPVLYQVMHQMAVCGSKAVIVVAFAAPEETFALIGKMAAQGASQEMLANAVLEIGVHEYPISRDDELIEAIVKAEVEFWNENIIARKTIVDLPRAMDTGKTKKASDAECAVINDLYKKWINSERAEAAYKEARPKVENIIGVEAAIESPIGIITWKKEKDSVSDVTDWEAIAKELKAPADVVAKHTRKDVVTKKGARKFLVPRSWKNDI
jgi:putative phage-type endonuclease